MTVKQITLGLLIAVAVVFVGQAAHAQVTSSRPIDIIVKNETNYTWQTNCIANKGSCTACPGSVNPSSIATFSFDAPTASVKGDSGDVILSTGSDKGMITITISFNHPYSHSNTTLSTSIDQKSQTVSTDVDGSQLQHHHAIGTVRIYNN